VLVPCYPSGVIYDLLECLYQYIDSAGLSNIPFYFISPVANSSLEFSQIFAEWYDSVLLYGFYLIQFIQTVKNENNPGFSSHYYETFILLLFYVCDEKIVLKVKSVTLLEFRRIIIKEGKMKEDLT
jgi:hypothetical protein